MKLFISFLLALTLQTSLAKAGEQINSKCKTVQKTFEGEADKMGESFVCLNAYNLGVQEAYTKGWSNCDERYTYDLSRSIFNSNHYYCTAYVSCQRLKCENDNK